MKDERDIKNLLQEHFGAFEAEPDRDLWPGIASELRKEGGTFKRVVPFWVRATAIAASLFLLMGLVWLLNEPPNAANQLADQQEQPYFPPAQTEQDQGPPGAESYPNQAADGGTDSPDEVSFPSQPIIQKAVERQAPRVEPKDLESNQEPNVIPNRDPRMARPGIQAMTPIHRQIAIRQEATESLPSKGVPAQIRRRSELRSQANTSETVETLGKRNQLDLNELTLANAVNFATEELSKWAESPVEIYSEQTAERQVRTIELDILNLRVTRKVYNKRLK